MRSAIWCLAIVTVCAMGLAPSSSALEPDANDPIPSLEHATTIRERLGLSTTQSVVERSLSDRAAFPNLDWDAPLAIEEVRELEHRAVVDAKLTSAAEWGLAQPGYAGFYRDNNRDAYVFLFTDVPANSGALQEFAPDEALVEVRTAPWSYEELSGLRDDIRLAAVGLERDGVEVNSVGIDVEANAVVVGLGVLMESSVTVVERRFPGPLLFRELGPIVADDCNSNADCWPPKGGFKIIGTDGSPDTDCTSGWMVKRTDQSSTRQLLTAGHCITVGGGEGSPWRHGSASGIGIGDGQGSTWLDPSTADVGLVGIVSTKVPAVRNEFISGTQVGGAPLVHNAVGWRPWFSQSTGQSVCRYGYTTLRECGTIGPQIDTDNKSCAPFGGIYDCRWITRTWEVNFDADGGDSGGPVFVLSGTFGTALGTHVHSVEGYVDNDPNRPSWYSPYDLGRSRYLARTGVTYNICTSASCPDPE